jgi:hypothetical protein
LRVFRKINNNIFERRVNFAIETGGAERHAGVAAAEKVKGKTWAAGNAFNIAVVNF